MIEILSVLLFLLYPSAIIYAIILTIIYIFVRKNLDVFKLVALVFLITFLIANFQIYLPILIILVLLSKRVENVYLVLLLSLAIYYSERVTERYGKNLVTKPLLIISSYYFAIQQDFSLIFLIMLSLIT